MMRSAAILVSCFFLSGFSSVVAQGSNWGPEEVDVQFEKKVYGSKVAMTAANINWLRNEFLIEKVSELSQSKRSDCALALHLLAAYASTDNPSSDDKLSIEKVKNSSSVYKAAEKGAAPKSNFSKKVFSSKDYFDYGDELFVIADVCERQIEPYYAEFDTLLDATEGVK